MHGQLYHHPSFPVADMEWLVPVEPPDPDGDKGTCTV